MQKQSILIAEDDFNLAHLLMAQCRQLGFEVLHSPNAIHALSETRRVKPSLLILDLNMPGNNGLSLCETIASDRTVSHIPVIIMSGQSDEKTICLCKMAGARFVSKGPKLWEQLAAEICECLLDESQPDCIQKSHSPLDISPAEALTSNHEATTNRPKIISIDDDPDFSKVLKLRLEPYGFEVFRAFGGMQGFWSCLDFRPDVIILDLSMNDGDGNYILHRLRAHSLTEKTPVIILTGQNNPAVKRQLISQGAEAYLNKPLVMEELLEHLLPLVRPAPAPLA